MVIWGVLYVFLSHNAHTIQDRRSWSWSGWRPMFIPRAQITSIFWYLPKSKANGLGLVKYYRLYTKIYRCHRFLEGMYQLISSSSRETWPCQWKHRCEFDKKNIYIYIYLCRLFCWNFQKIPWCCCPQKITVPRWNRFFCFVEFDLLRLSLRMF